MGFPKIIRKWKSIEYEDCDTLLESLDSFQTDYNKWCSILGSHIVNRTVLNVITLSSDKSEKRVIDALKGDTIYICQTMLMKWFNKCISNLNCGENHKNKFLSIIVENCPKT
tara:strand:- start:8006 stop:8341 length:336 start_codon:yes stop_codon:yes gene_type:complete